MSSRLTTGLIAGAAAITAVASAGAPRATAAGPDEGSLRLAQAQAPDAAEKKRQQQQQQQQQQRQQPQQPRGGGPGPQPPRAMQPQRPPSQPPRAVQPQPQPQRQAPPKADPGQAPRAVQPQPPQFQRQAPSKPEPGQAPRAVQPQPPQFQRQAPPKADPGQAPRAVQPQAPQFQRQVPPKAEPGQAPRAVQPQPPQFQRQVPPKAEPEQPPRAVQPPPQFQRPAPGPKAEPATPSAPAPQTEPMRQGQPRPPAAKPWPGAPADAGQRWPKGREREAGDPGRAGPREGDQSARRLDDIRGARRQRVEAGGRRVIEEPGRRFIVRENNRTFIRHDDTERFRRFGRDFRTERRGNQNLSVYRRPDGSEIVTYYDDNGRLLRRVRRVGGGREIILIDNRRHWRPGHRGVYFPVFVALAPPIIRIPHERYIVDYHGASFDDVYDALAAPPIDDVPRAFSLEEVTQTVTLRDRMRRVDLDVINFEFGSWEVDQSEQHKLERAARAMQRILDGNPDEIFLVEGHTDAVGSDEDNLSLSDRRAESVAVILTEAFGIPPENLITQGYGEQFLKIPTDGPERANRRVSIRRITPLLSGRAQ